MRRRLSPRALRVRVSARLIATILLAGAVLFLAAVVRLAPNTSFAPIPGVYRGYSVYDIAHILETGREVRPNSATGNVTSYSSGIYVGTEDILRHKVDAAVMLLLGMSADDLPQYYRFGFWSPLIVVPLAVFGLAAAVARGVRGRLDYLAILALLAFAVLGSSNMIAVSYHGEANTATGWWMLIAALYGLVRIPENPTIGRVVFFTFSGLLVLLYHTSALILGSSVLALAILAAPPLRTKLGAPYAVTTMLVVMVGVLTYHAYVSVSYFTLYARTLASVPTLVDYLLWQRGGPPRDLALRSVVAPSDPTVRGLTIALAVLVAIPVLALLVLAIRRRLSAVAGTTGTTTILPWILGLVPFSVGLFAWSGLSGVYWKTGEFGSVYALIALAALFVGRLRNTHRLALALLVAACVALSSSIFYQYQRHGPSQLTEPELAAADWVVQRAAPKDAIFTDLRLASPIIARGHLAVYGVNDQEDASRVREILDAVYYSTDASDALAAIQSIQLPPGMSPRFMVFSKRMAMDVPGIKGFDYTFRAAAEGFTDKLLGSDHVSLVYDNGTVRIFELV